MNTNEVASVLEHLKEGFHPFFKVTEQEAFNDLIQLFKDAPDISIKQFSNQVRSAWGTAPAVNSSGRVRTPRSRSTSAGRLSLDQALELYSQLAEEAPNLSLEEVEAKYHPMLNMTLADLKNLAQKIQIVIPSKLSKAEVIQAIITPLRQKTITATATQEKSVDTE